MNNLTPQQRQKRLRRLLIFLAVTFFVVLGMGMLGFRYIVGVDWLDSFYNSALHFAGSGPDVPIRGTRQKLFVAIYGVVAGLVFVGLAVWVIDTIAELELFESES